jgi:hypothetical protein
MSNEAIFIISFFSFLSINSIAACWCMKDDCDEFDDD